MSTYIRVCMGQVENENDNNDENDAWIMIFLYSEKKMSFFPKDCIIT